MSAFWSLSGAKRTRVGLDDPAFACRVGGAKSCSASSLKGAATGTATIQ
jgi:hypothetical protein